jgi:glycosyltransferase involved in cell wall biosynthesis
LKQTYGNFEIIISDNSSTDGTEIICKTYASKDKRIRYYRQKTNKGAGWNYNFVFKKAKGKYFKWSADDDLCSESYLEECVHALNNNNVAVLAFTFTPHIDLEGKIIGRNSLGHPVGHNLSVHQRLKNLMCYEFGDDCRPIFGVIRSNILRKTRLMGCFHASDQALLVELILCGPFIEIPKPLQFRRIHPIGSERCFDGRHRERAKWYSEKYNKPFLLPMWRLFYEFFKRIYFAPIKLDLRLLCFIELGRWLRWGRGNMMIEELLTEIKLLNRSK